MIVIKLAILLLMRMALQIEISLKNAFLTLIRLLEIQNTIKINSQI